MDYMRQALSLARLASGQVSPNPAVGAVLVKDNTVIGQGFTRPPGSSHAEIVALKQAGAEARGSTMFVTLEPCSHFGRTPPCSRAIVAAGVSEVHLAMLDPNPLVSGKGKCELEEAGVKVYAGEHQDEAREVVEAYVQYITKGIPLVTAKFAMSLDGKIATSTGDSRWISGGEARRYVHVMRYTSDAIMVGVNTVLADDPHLTARISGGRGGTSHKQPLRIIVDSRGRTPPDARIFREPGKTLVVVGSSVSPEKIKALRAAGAELLELPGEDGLVDLKGLLKELGNRSITSVMVEGGGVLLGSLFDLGLVDKVVTFISPLIIGGSEARIPVAGRGVTRLMDALKLERVSVEKLGDDIMVSGYILEKQACLPEL